MKKVLKHILYYLLPIGITLFLVQFVFMIVFIPSGSMEPTIPSGGLSLAVRYHGNAMPDRGDIVVFTHDDPAVNKNTNYIKRVVGCPGDIVEIRQGIVYINNEAYSEPWLAETPLPMDYPAIVVPQGEFFLLGDNRNHSLDSRYWTEKPTVPNEHIRAKAIYVFKKSGGEPL